MDTFQVAGLISQPHQLIELEVIIAEQQINPESKEHVQQESNHSSSSTSS